MAIDAALRLAGAVLGLGVVSLGYLAWYLAWEKRKTAGLGYFSLTSSGRATLKADVRRLGAPARLVARMLAAITGPAKAMPSFTVRGVHGPPAVSSAEIFERAAAYRPTGADIFVATQMRCGTTWMQQVVYEIVMDGHGRLGDQGHGHLYAMSPWIDAANSVSMEAAPLVGDPPARIVKTHLPVSLMPYSPDARYVYVTRHPVACFASIREYVTSLSGPLAPPLPVLLQWYCSDAMYWSSWPVHVAGWWDWSRQYPNVLFVHYEEMKADLGAVVARVAAFLERPLSADARARVVEKCSFEYMKAHDDVFEMAPPTMFSVVGGKFFASGKSTRADDVPPDARAQILAFCRAQLAGRSYAAADFYRELTAPGR